MSYRILALDGGGSWALNQVMASLPSTARRPQATRRLRISRRPPLIRVAASCSVTSRASFRIGSGGRRYFRRTSLSAICFVRDVAEARTRLVTARATNPGHLQGNGADNNSGTAAQSDSLAKVPVRSDRCRRAYWGPHSGKRHHCGTRVRALPQCLRVCTSGMTAGRRA